MERQIDEATARRVLEDAKRKRRDEISEKRAEDRVLKRPHHFHGTVWTYVWKDASGNMTDATHHEVFGLSPDSCIRKAVNRGSPEQTSYHVTALTECHDVSHTSGMDD